ncbi:otogelin-like [Cricetulus griseus]
MNALTGLSVLRRVHVTVKYSKLSGQGARLVHNSPKCLGSVYSCYRSISLFFSNQEEIRIYGHEIKMNGIRLSLPQTIGQVYIEKLADYILVKSTFGFSLAWDGISGIYLKLSEEHRGKSCGLCANYNGIQSDDFVIQQEDYTEDIAMFANSWMVQTLDDPKCIPTPSDFPNPCSSGMPAFEAIFFKCQILLQFPFLSCHEYIDPYLYIASCVNDLCKTDDDETYCRAATEYARACSHAGFPIQDWRDDFPACTDKCDDSFVHRDCISCCPPSCTFEKQCLGSNLHCLDGCYCADVQCSVVGDSHFTTFDGRHYSFIGLCQYILVKGTGKDKFTITLQKAHCEQNLGLVCLQSITLILEDDFNKQVTLSRGGQILTSPNQGFTLNGIVEIQTLSSLFILLRTTFGLKILFAIDGERIYIQLSSEWKRRTLGLCGTFNGNIRDDFLSPSGMIEGTPQLHAHAWRVSSTCFAPVHVPMVDPCNINQQNIGYAAHCDVIHQELFAPCHVYVSPGLYYQLCRHDACKCGSSCLCNALAHYAYLCGQRGVPIDFRAQISFCGEYDNTGRRPGNSFDRSVSSQKCCSQPAHNHCSGFHGNLSTDDTDISVIAQNKKCFDNDIVCSKSVLISIGDTEIYLNDAPYKQKRSGFFLESKPTYKLWKAGHYIVVYFPEEDITILWDEKTTIHIKVGPQWKNKLAGLCGNFDKCTSNDMTTSNNLEVRNAQVFGDSWALGQCEDPIEALKPCEAHQNKFPYAKKECSILYSDVFAPCRNVIDVTSFAKNCHEDTCNCNLGGDCECLCTSVAAYAYKCCQEGVPVRWRSPTVCALALISLESAERPNYFLYVHDNDTLGLLLWQANSVFRQRATFFHHQGLWIPGYSAFELYSKKGFFIVFTDSSVKASKYDDSEEFKQSSSFSIEEIQAVVPYRRMCEWRYEPCATPCFRTCSDPEALACAFLPPVEGCLPYCPKHMILDEVTLKCVYPEDCRCSMLSELSIITFDGNSAALSSKASYILVRIPGEIVVVHIEKCSLNQVDVDSIVVPLPFSSQDLFIEDSGTMYVITTPAGLIIKWAHLTGIIDIHFSPQFNLSSYTEGLCGCTDNEDQPRSVGEIWNGGVDECALYKCLEDGSIIPVEPVCEEEPSPICEREAEVVMGIIDELTCCSKEVCGCDMTLCDKTIPGCTSSQKLIVGYSALSCCPQYECGKHVDSCLLECNCENLVIPICEVEGKTWHYNCTTYECVKTDEGATILNYTFVCPPFNETECKLNEGIVKLYNEGCCKICKREERMCQKVIIKSMIKKQDCVSQTSISVASCDGKCPSATIYNINVESHLRFCKCCRENGFCVSMETCHSVQSRQRCGRGKAAEQTAKSQGYESRRQATRWDHSCALCLLVPAQCRGLGNLRDLEAPAGIPALQILRFD